MMEPAGFQLIKRIYSMKWLNKFFNKNTLQELKTLSVDAKRWNKFINEICFKDQSNLTLIQRAAVLSF
jgi:hypothetical protein